MRLPCLVEIDGRQRRVVVIHPLWRSDPDAMPRLGVATPGARTLLIDTFDLERRPLRALEMVEERRVSPAVQVGANAQA
jgi:hypothetical protein